MYEKKAKQESDMSKIPGIKFTEILQEVLRLRKTLHRYPELSGQERQTAGWIKANLEKHDPEMVIEGIGGHSLAAIFDSRQAGPTLMLRADIDALPIVEVNDFSHKSQHEGVSHKCGHDGHAAILTGIAAIVSRNRPAKGRLVLLFQAEEETGQGAEKIIKDPKFKEIIPDMVFSLHNLPGFKKHAIILKDGAFASASKGVIIQLNGSSSHAAHPELGVSPGPMLPELISGLLDIPKNKTAYKDFTLITIIHVRLGEVAFGTNPGKGVVMATLRSFSNTDMHLMTKKLEKLVHDLSKKFGVKPEISYTEVFPATHNNKANCEIVRKAAEWSGASLHPIDLPFRWSEDFGHFAAHYPSALFGVGAGRKHPSLHQNDYDFPDDIIPTALNMFYNIADQVLNLSDHV